MHARAMEACVEKYFSAIGAGDELAWIACFAPEGTLHDPADAPPLAGEAALRDFYQAARGAFAELNLRVQRCFVCGNQAAVHFYGEGVGKNGRAVRFDGIDLFEFDTQARVLSVRGYWDLAALFEQLE